MREDLTDARAGVINGSCPARERIERSIVAATAPASARAFLSTRFDAARAAADAADRAVAAGRDPGRLAGLAV